MKFVSIFLVVGLVGGSAMAECPAVPDHALALAELAERANAAPSEAEGRKISDQMWELWVDAPDEQAQAVLDRGMLKRGNYDLLGAIADFDTLVEYCPDYAEGYNQRAFAFFIRQDFSAALVDLDRALVLSPRHVGALSGRALTHMQLGDSDKARDDLRAALAINPWLSERHLLAKGAPLAPPGDDI